jgi:hypothetical protein
MVEFYGWVMNVGGKAYQTRNYKKYKEFEQAVANYMGALDVFKVEMFRRIDGKSQYIGTEKRKKMKKA